MDYNSLKLSLLSLVRKHVYPGGTVPSGSLTWNSGTLSQNFYPFSSSVSAVELYVEEVVGSPGAVTLQLVDYSGTVKKSSTLSLSTGWNTFPCTLTDLVSKKPYSFRLTSSLDSSNYYVLGTSAEYYYGTLTLDSSTLTSDLCFRVNVGEFLYPAYPYLLLQDKHYPLVVLDISGRPRVIRRYFSPEILDEQLTFTFYVYSRYPDEIDELVEGIDYAVLKESHNLQGVLWITHGPTSALSRWRDNYFVRSVTYTARALTTLPL